MSKCKKCGRRYERNPWNSLDRHRCELDSKKMSPWVLRILMLILFVYACIYMFTLGSHRG